MIIGCKSRRANNSIRNPSIQQKMKQLQQEGAKAKIDNGTIQKRIGRGKKVSLGQI